MAGKRKAAVVEPVVEEVVEPAVEPVVAPVVEDDPNAPDDADGETENTVEEKVYGLTKELYEMQDKKKSSNKAFSDEIKRIKGEIEDLLNEEETPEEKEEENE